jgi:hypothetical protein
MGEVGMEGKRGSRKRKVKASRKNAIADALPDVQPPGGLKETSLEDDVTAESDEEDD